MGRRGTEFDDVAGAIGGRDGELRGQQGCEEPVHHTGVIASPKGEDNIKKQAENIN